MKKQKFFNFKLNENKDLSNFYVNETNNEAFKTLDESHLFNKIFYLVQKNLVKLI